MRVYFIPLDGIDYDDEHWGEHVDHYAVEGEMTTDHPASSYGSPVIAGEDGTPYGPGDIYDGDWSGIPGAARDTALEQAANAAGFSRQPNYGETGKTY